MNQIRNFCVLAHIDHGKSTLADRFLEITKTISREKLQPQHLDRMSLERERGITIKMHPVRMVYKNFILNLIDTPGHVDFSYEVSRSLKACEGAILLCDATQGIQAQTLANYFLAKTEGLVIIPVVNKIDLPNAQPKKASQELAELVRAKEDEVIFISAKLGTNIEKILEAVIKKIKAPTGDIDKPLRALVFDSLFDQHRGVIAYVRVFDGRIKKGDKINLLGSGKISTALEVGIFKPEFSAKEILEAGEIGYIATGFKETKDCRIGDTITEIRNPKSEIRNDEIKPLPGYQEPQPMVFASFYCADSQNYLKLKESLGKLSLNDAAFTFKPEKFSDLGFGFRCGFLGLLHLEIIKERLEREFNLNLIATSPSVSYQIITKNNQEKLIHSPEEMSEAGEVKEIREPWIGLEIFSPGRYLGPIMELVKKFRGLYKKTDYLGEEMILFYEMPLASFLDNFYNGLKNVSAGYASLSYQFIGYRPADLAKIDVLIAGKKISALSAIVPKEKIQIEGNRLTAQLKKILPRQLFEIPIQAAVGSRIISRETIPALKKNVTAKLYGGDRTRKEKLWQKQRAGKKRLKEIGGVRIPQEAFFAILKNRRGENY